MAKTADEARAQIMKLDLKLGKGVGAVKERAKLQAIIDAPDTPKKVSRQKKQKQAGDAKPKTKRSPRKPASKKVLADLEKARQAELDRKIKRSRRQGNEAKKALDNRVGGH